MTEEKKPTTGRLGILVAALFLLIIIWFSPLNAPSWPQVGDVAPNINAMPVEGTMPNMTNQVVLLDFWATWCPPCEIWFPVVDDMHRRYSSRGLIVLGISADIDRRDMQRFLARHKVSFPNVRDAFGHLTQALNAQTLPRTYLIGADGKFAAVHEGFIPGKTDQELRNQIEAALKAAGK